MINSLWLVIFRCVSIPSSYPGESVRVRRTDTAIFPLCLAPLDRHRASVDHITYFPKAMSNSFQIFIRGVKKETYFSEKINKHILDPNFFDPKLTWPKLCQTELCEFI